MDKDYRLNYKQLNKAHNVYENQRKVMFATE